MSADLSRRLAKLEATHKRILRCPLCRYSLSNIPPKRRKRYSAEPASVLATKCWHCGTQYLVPLPRSDEHFRLAADLHYNSHPTKHFNDARVHAANLWLGLHLSQREKYEKERREQADRSTQPRVSRSASQPMRGTLTLRERKEKEAREELKQRAQEFIRARQEYFKRRACGSESFPLDETVKALDADRVHAYSGELELEVEALGLEKYGDGTTHYRSQTATIKNAILTLRKREACEVVIWGKVLPDTIDEIAFFEALLPKVIEEATEKDREEKEKKAREATERQRQHEEYLARQRGEPMPVKQENGRATHQRASQGIEMVEIPPEKEKKSGAMEALKYLLPPNIYEMYKADHEAANKERFTGNLNISNSPFERKEPEPTPRSDNGTLLYQRKLAHWRRTGEWLPDSRCPADWSY